VIPAVTVRYEFDQFAVLKKFLPEQFGRHGRRERLEAHQQPDAAKDRRRPS
jgi:hypothetical protein